MNMKKPGKKSRQLTKTKLQKSGKRTVPDSVKKRASSKKQPAAKSQPDVGNLKLTETVALKKIKTDNERLTRLLEKQNRELEIEAALEKVRSRSLAMHKTEELKEVVFTVFEQLRDLGIKTDSTIILVFDDDQREVAFWVANEMNYATRFNTPFNIGPFPNEFYQARKKQLPFTKTFPFKDKNKNWKELFEKTDFRNVPAKRKKFLLEKTDSFIETIANGKKTGIMLCRYFNLAFTTNETDILQRFANVFEQAYTRFLDLQKAEAQSREAQIELGLERVRARAMAMQHSSELADLVATVFNELNHLDFSLASCIIWIHNPSDKSNALWIASDKFNKPAKPLQIVPFYPEFFTSILAAWKAKDQKWTFPLAGTEKKKFQKLFFKQYPDLPEALKKSMTDNKQIVFSASFNNFGALEAVAKGPLNDKQFEILHRFGNVFNSSYTRFNDLKKAEAQAREAQIEAALERIRARALAMHTSQELQHVADVLREQMRWLGQPELEGTVIQLLESNPGYVESWHAFRPGGNPEAKLIQGRELFDIDCCEVIQELVQRYQSSAKEYTIIAQGSKLKEWIAVLGKKVPEVLKMKMPDTLYYHCSDFSGGTLLLSTANQASEEAKQLLTRSANVFDLAYKRFLDLQKAEAQAREAQIELALERVRARSLAMHHTSELQEVVNIAAQQLQKIGIDINGGVFICINKEVDSELTIWASGGMADYVQKVAIPALDKPIFIQIRDAIKKGDSFLVQSFNDKEKVELFTHLFQLEPWQSLQKERKQELLSRKGGFSRSVIISHYTSISITNHNGKAFSESENDILKRFGRVFEQSYIRFLDLQKAEAQTRESQIQLALERVRARTMAMHHSSELANTATILFQQIKELGFEIWSCGFGIWRPEVDLEEAWMSTGDLFPIIMLPFREDPTHLSIYEASQRGESVFEVEVKGEVLSRHYDWLMSQPSFKIVFSQIENSGIILPIVQYKYAAFFKQGYLHLITTKPQPDIHNINQRFAKVFEQTYTRFLDLQKAETQTREAEVELALERVRAKTMAMHRSDELREVVAVLYEQMTALGLAALGCELILCDEETELLQYWSIAPGGAEQPDCYPVPKKSHPVFQLAWQAWKKRTPRLVVTLKGQEKRKFDKHIFEKTAFMNFPERAKKIIKAGKVDVFSLVTMKYGLLEAVDIIPLPEDKFAILERFAKVFEQTYTRFLDLQKAEAQAREAQIEAALERVRAQTMAMHNSEDVGKCVVKMFAELTALGVDEGTRFGIGILNHDNENNQLWTAKHDGEEVKMHIGNLDMKSHPLLKSARKAWKEQVPFHHYILEGEDLHKYYQMLNDAPDYKIQIPIEKLPERELHYGFIFEHGFFYAFTPHEFQPDLIHIIQRFSSVFSQTYRRYLDLVKAEAQAREAQIQLALERVRARTMAMQKSDELPETSLLLFQQVKELGMTAVQNSIGIVNEESGFVELSTTVHGHPVPRTLQVPIDDPYVMAKAVAAWKAKHKSLNLVFEGQELKNYNEHRNSFFETKVNFPEDQWVVYIIFFSKGWLSFSGNKSISDETVDLLKRFGAVFEQTYTRFNDLKQAEEQARESQIQLAMERVRARTMAMQKSDELPEAANLLFQQVQSLGMPAWSAGYCIWEDDKKAITLWMSSEGVLQPPFKLPLTEDPSCIHFLEAHQKGETFYVEEIGGEELVKHYKYMRSLPVVGEVLQSINDAGFPLPTFQIFHCAYFSRGFLLFITYEPVPEAHDIFKRFAKVFEQIYTRFLDLQKAEAQAREAQIEAALERVRSRSMAMHKSDELNEVIAVLYEQLQLLQVGEWGCSLNIYNKTENYFDIWLSTDTQRISPQSFRIEGQGHQLIKENWDIWKSQEQFRFIELKGQVKVDYDEYVMSQTGLKYLPAEIKRAIKSLPETYASIAAMIHGTLNSYSGQNPLSKDDFIILQRFAKVFEQSYTRFLDLQKAEAQAREAQIEAALERVRSRSMGMQKSEELREVIQVIYEQFLQLNIAIDGAGFAMDYMASDDFNFWLADATSAFPYQVHIPYFDHPQFNRFKEAKEKGLDFYSSSLTPEERNEFFDHISKYIPIPQELKEAVYHAPGYETSHVVLKNVILYILNFSGRSFSEADNATLMRFGKAFEQTYIRFNDLKQAEAQAREAQIEAALERVRSRSMGMQKSEELKEVIKLVYQQLIQLKINLDHAGFVVDYKPGGDWHFWIADEQDIPSKITHPWFESVWANQFNEAKEKGVDFFATQLNFEEKNKFYQELLSYVSDLPEASKDFYLNCPGLAATTVLFDNVSLYTENFSGIPYTDEENKTLMRVGKVFQQTYTRFLDLQKAEAQAREAQIEAALERVRSRSMGMHKSDELREVIQLVFEQLQQLNFSIDSAQFDLNYKESDDLHVWTAVPGQPYPTQQYIPYINNPIMDSVKQAKENGLTFFSHVTTHEEKNEFFQHFFNHIRNVPEDRKKYIFDSPGYARSVVFLDKLFLGIQNYSGIPYSEIENAVLRRFGKVFEQSYTRFLDLQKAEAQARQAQIELGLERLRARAMAMKKSEELAEVISTVFTELTKLDFALTRTMLWFFNEKTYSMEVWMANSEGGKTPGHWPMSVIEHPFHKRIFDTWKERRPKWVYELKGDEKKQLDDYLFTKTIAANLPEEVKAGIRAPERIINSFSFHDFGGLLADGLEELSPENLEILYRFSKEFDLTYTRFLDLQKAEAQTREALIEASLERVRGKAMAMHSSEDLTATIAIFYRELELFSITPRRCGVALLDKETHMAELSTMNTTERGDSIEIVGTMKMQGHPVLEGVFDHWILQKEYHPVLRGNEIKEYYTLLRPQISFPEYSNDAVQYGYCFFFPEGGVYAWTEKEMKEDELRIYRRFTSVLSLTYKRYKDLKDAEARALLAIRESSLDRVRASIASMRTAEDLQRITPLIWHELIALGVPFFRCGVFIVNEEEKKIRTYLTNPQGKSLAVLNLSFESSETNRKAVEHWRLQKVYTDHWDKEQFTAFAKSLIDEGQIETTNTYQGGDEPPEALTLQFIPFPQGMLYVGSAEPLSASQIELVQALAEAFSVAYARYEDFTRLEAAKQQIERTLVDLKQTQAQLVQSEKMASLGELTAGIAHEIQNPLNFVNNFSEINTELIDELKKELTAGSTHSDSYQKAEEILSDIKANSEKINNHGKRAGDIVKGMLQHSRTSSAQKELTDLNGLADEYLRLAYHGLRAKDKSFHAKFETHLDPTLPKINVVPQEIGRVILNLINNSFYAVNEKVKRETANVKAEPSHVSPFTSRYEPLVVVSTKKLDEKIQISVKDNGPGIPDSIKEKIFQPFFTTKPTGHGTGLGLSLSYDIVKAHGGELKVETKLGEVSEFIILLPIV
jgi:signal transduction histidine kinase/DNA-directed RNA polymerase subunit N (RpoN/RPB10)